MFKNFLTTAFRNIARYKGFAIVNIAGLTLGLTSSLLIGLFVWDEFQYDKSIPNEENVFRIANHYTNTEESSDRAIGPPMFAVTLAREFPEIEAVTRVMMLPDTKRLFEAGEKKFYEQSGYFVDSTFFQVFGIHFIHGTPVNSLNRINNIVLSSEMAERIFGKENPVGKQLMQDKQPYVVTGVFEKDPTFHLQFNYLIPQAAVSVPAERMQSWTWQQFYTYAKVRKGADVSALQTRFQKLVKERSAPFLKDVNGNHQPFFQPLADIHLHSAGFKFDVAGHGNITYVRALSIIAIFILLIACFNFINLATAKSLQRAKEVGVRKSIGADRTQLLLQFTGETVLFSYISVLLSFLLTALLLPLLNQFTGKHISSLILLQPAMLLLMMLLGLVTGIIAGFYPAWVLSAFQPVKVLKGSVSGEASPGGVGWLRQTLVVIQFTLSALLMISAIIVFKQVTYLHRKDLGFNKEQLMFFPMRSDSMFHNTEAFKNRLLELPGVSSVSIGYGFPGDAVAGDEIQSLKNGIWVTSPATQLMVDYDYIKTMGLTLVAGRAFDKEMKTDKDKAFVINETAVQQLGYGTPAKAIGQRLSWNRWDGHGADSIKTGTVIGVVKDFHYKSLYDKMEITVLQIFPEAAWKVAVKVNTAGISGTLKSVEKVWNEFSPDYPLEYNFMDENFAKMYQEEDKLQSLVWIFTCLAIFIGCMGLFGLTAYAAQRRKKELGIRKVLGASTHGLVVLLSKDFIKFVFLSLAIASPIAWILMNKWLQHFAYRISIGWETFAFAGFSVLLIAVLTVSLQAIKAALANPVNTLRNE